MPYLVKLYRLHCSLYHAWEDLKNGLSEGICHYNPHKNALNTKESNAHRHCIEYRFREV